MLIDEPTILNIVGLVDSLSCPRCGRAQLFVYDDTSRLLIDPDNVTVCSNPRCENPIPLPRLETFPDTNSCGLEHEEIKVPSPSTWVDVSKQKGGHEFKTDDEESFFERLRELRLQLAKDKKVPAFYIFPDKTLLEMVQRKPTTREEFSQIHGVGPAKLENLSDLFLELINELVDEAKVKDEQGVTSNNQSAVSLEEAAQQLAKLEIQKGDIESEIKEYRDFLKNKFLHEEKLEIPTAGDTEVRIYRTPPTFIQAIVKEEFKEVPTELLNELIDREYVEETQELVLNDEVIQELPSEEQSALFEKGIVESKINRKEKKREKDINDNEFINRLKEMRIFEDKPNRVVFRKKNPSKKIEPQ